MTQNTPPSPAPPPAPPTAVTLSVHRQLAAMLEQSPSAQNLNAALRLLAKWRSTVVGNTIRKRDGLVVQSGPFQGMHYMASAAEGSSPARLLGVYEATLHPVIEDICTCDYAQIIDVGCAEGYYAVGLARRLPAARVFARDSNPIAREKCAQLAALNGVAGQMDIGGAVAHGYFDICFDAKTLVICDIEGGEDALLDPVLARGLLAADILVEAHDCFASGLSARLAQRFAASHDVQIIHRAEAAHALPDWMNTLSDLDRLIALWEWRIGPTPWLWMKAKPKGARVK